ncbi:MAG: TetR/AcrR family transcriptional regulator, partial [Gaiellaceae bacterium]
VYRHFPDEAALFDACSAHWAAANPPPKLDAWSAIDSPDERLRVALDELYAFYRQTEPMLDNLFRDATTMPLVQERFIVFRGYLAIARDTLMVGRKLRGAARLRTRAALGHAIAFSTWKSLVHDQGLNDADAAALARAFVTAAS